MRKILTRVLLAISVVSFSTMANAQQNQQYQFWLELFDAEEAFGQRASEIGRTNAFLEFLGKDSVVFRAGPVDAQALYSTEEFRLLNTDSELIWKAHYLDVSRDGDLGVSAGPSLFTNATGEQFHGHLVSIWQKTESEWQLMADMLVGIPGFLSMDVEAKYSDIEPVLAETAHPAMANRESNTLFSLIEADNLFGESINFRGGQRALLRYGLENSRVYLPGMAPAVGAESASSVYGAFLDSQLFTTNPISLNFEGGYLSSSKDMGYTYGTMTTNTTNSGDAGLGFKTNYLRLWRFTDANEWRVAVEVLNPFQ